jgi:hypothetical protein
LEATRIEAGGIETFAPEAFRLRRTGQQACAEGAERRCGDDAIAALAGEPEEMRVPRAKPTTGSLSGEELRRPAQFLKIRRTGTVVASST